MNIVTKEFVQGYKEYMGHTILGAFIGGVVFNFFGAQRVTGFNLHSVLVSVVGACILLWILNKINKK